MRTPPPIPLPTIAAAVRTAHGFEPTDLTFVGGGEEAWGFRVEASAGPFWLKIYDHASVIEGRLSAAHSLRHAHGIAGVVAPLPASTGAFTFDIAGRRAALFPYIPGPTSDDQPLTQAQAAEFGRVLAAVHAVDSSTLSLPVEQYATGAADDAEAVLLALPDALESPNPFRRAMAELLLPVRDGLYARVTGFRAAADVMRSRPAPLVVCHGDPTDDNIVIGERVFLLDWDDMRLGPKEIDLMHFEPDSPVIAAYVAASGTAIDPAPLDFCRLKWDNEEIRGFAGRVLFEDSSVEQHQHDLDIMRQIVRHWGLTH